MDKRHFIRATTVAAVLAAGSVTLAPRFVAAAAETDTGAALNGIVTTKSAYSIGETINRVTDDIIAKGIMLFGFIDQAKLAKDAGVELRPSTLIVFGNPSLGTQFLTADAEAGLDWPVRLFVFEDASGQVWTAYSVFGWIAQRHGIESRQAEFAKASEVIASIVASVTQ